MVDSTPSQIETEVPVVGWNWAHCERLEIAFQFAQTQTQFEARDSWARCAS